MCTRFDSEVNSHTSTRKLVTTLMLTNTYSHKHLRKIKVTICNYQADSVAYV